MRFADAIRALVQARGVAEVFGNISAAVETRSKRLGYPNVDAFLDAHHIRHPYRNAVKETHIDAAAAVNYLARLGVLDGLFTLAHSPWPTVRKHGEVVFVVGQRVAVVDYDPTLYPRRSLSDFDVMAVDDFEDLLESFGLEPRQRIHRVADRGPVDANAKFDRHHADEELEKILTMYHHAAIIVFLGSPRLNMVADAAARLIFERAGVETSFAKFRFSKDFGQQDTFLCELCGTQNDEGIFCNNTLSPREHDASVRQKIAAIQAANQGDLEKARFKCAGMLLMDFSAEVPFVVAAGHSGLSTYAALSMFQDHPNLIADSLTEEGRLGCDRAMHVLAVDRYKLTCGDMDDFQLADSRVVWSSHTAN